MAMSNTRLGSAIAATIQSFKPAAGTQITTTQLEQMWQAIAQDFIDEVNNHADITLNAADIPVPAAGIIDSNTGACTGQAVNAATGPLTGRIS